MTAIGRAWILSKKSRTLKTSSAGAVRLGWCGIISTKSRNDFVRSESREAGALPGGAQRRHRDRLRRNSIANDRAVEEHRVLLAPPPVPTQPPPTNRPARGRPSWPANG